jgi:hypothetical protein
MLYLNYNLFNSSPATPANNKLFYETISHEMQHLINYNVKVFLQSTHAAPETWLTEGLSTSAEYVYLHSKYSDSVSYSSTSADTNIYHYLDDYNTSGAIASGTNFINWQNYYDNYATAFLFFQWLRVQSSKGTNGEGIYTDIVGPTSGAGPGSGADAVIYAVTVNNDISALSGAAWKDILRNWLIANAFCTTANPLYGYGSDYLNGHVTYHTLASGAGSPYTLAPGEAIYLSVTNSTITPSGDIDYTGLTFPSTADTDQTGGYTGTILLCYNYNSSPTAASSTIASLPSITASMTNSNSVSASHQSAFSNKQMPDLYIGLDNGSTYTYKDGKKLIIRHHNIKK